MKTTAETSSAGGFVLNEENKLLMVEEYGYYWGMPRGHVWPGESLEDAARREIREETGMNELSLPFKVGSYKRSTFGKDGKPNYREIKNITFFCFRAQQTDLALVDPAITNAKWQTFSEARARLINDSDINFFDVAIEQIKQRLSDDGISLVE